VCIAGFVAECVSVCVSVCCSVLQCTCAGSKAPTIRNGRRVAVFINRCVVVCVGGFVAGCVAV